MRLARSLPFMALAAAVFVGACSSDSSVGPSEHQPADLSQVLSEMTLAGVSPAISMSPVSVNLGAPTPGSCGYNGTDSFVCPTVTAGGLTISQSYSLFDQSGTAQSAFSTTSTAAVRTTTTAIGTVSSQGDVLHIDHKQVLTLSGLLTGKHVLDGTMLSKLDGTSTLGGMTFPHSDVVSTLIDRVELPRSGTSTTPWPLSGSITTTATSQQSGVPDISLTIRIVFNGTSRVPVTITAPGFSQTCFLDLSAGAPTCS
jgi:hypothetical protein